MVNLHTLRCLLLDIDDVLGVEGLVGLKSLILMDCQRLSKLPSDHIGLQCLREFEYSSFGHYRDTEPQWMWIRGGEAARPEIPDFFEPDRKLLPVHPPDFKKHHCPFILEGHLSTNPIWSALHLQGPKSNIYVHFH